MITGNLSTGNVVHGPRWRTTELSCHMCLFLLVTSLPGFLLLFIYLLASLPPQPPLSGHFHLHSLCSAAPGVKAWKPSLPGTSGQLTTAVTAAQTRRADVIHLRPVPSVKWQKNLAPPLRFVDETEAHRWKVVRAAQPAGLESSSFSSLASRPHPCA